MEWADIGKLVAKAAPLAGTVLAGPAGTAIGGLVASLFGVDPEPDRVAAAIAADPEAALKMKQLDLDNKVELQKLILEQERLRYQDTASARMREVETTKATGTRDTTLYAFAWLIAMGFFGLLAVLVFVKVPQDSSGVVFMLFGSLSSAFGAVIQYFFGSSKGSDEKTRMLAQTEPIKVAK